MPIPRPPQAVTFDCWSTLIVDEDSAASLEARSSSLLVLATRRGLELGPARAREILEGSWQAHVAAWRNGELFGPEGAARWCLARLGIEVDEALAAELARAIAEATHEAGIRIVEGAPEALEAVRRRHIPTALVCDTGFTPGSVVREALQELGLRLDHYVFSDEVGVPKPNPLIFRSALQATGADPERAVHIGDLRRTDVAGARAAGMATIRFAGVHDDSWADEEARGEEADAVLRRWADLLELLGF